VLLNNALAHRVGLLTEEATRWLVAEAGGAEEPVFDDSALERVLDLAGGHPYFAQLIASHLLSHRNVREIPVLSRADVDSRLDRIFEEGHEILTAVWERSRPRERLILSRLAAAWERGESRTLPGLAADLFPSGGEARRIELNRAVETLIDREILEDTALAETHPPLRLRVGLYREWLRKFKRNAIEQEGLTWE
jgi:hypothetical protein